MDNYDSSNPFQGILPPIQHPPYAPPFAPEPPPQTVSDPASEPSEAAPTPPPAAQRRAGPENQEIIEDPQFSYDGYQVVRGEFFSHINEPSITFFDNRFSVNTACLKKSPYTEFVQVLVNQDEKKLAVRPCSEDVKDSFAWCTARRKTKKVICPLFFGKIMSLMGWSTDHRYKIIGKLVRSQGQNLFVFDLKSPEIYTRSVLIDENGNEKRKISRKPVYPDSWKDHFGLPVEEHQQAIQINLFDGYALIGVKEPKQAPAKAANKAEEEEND